MLTKLIKYDIKWLMKIIVIFLGIGLIFTLAAAFFELFNESLIFDIISKICKGTALSMLISAIFNVVIRGWVRFSTNLYKDESYLSHTLPISKTTHLASKVITSVVSVLVCCVVLFISILIMYIDKDTITKIKEMFNLLSTTLNGSVYGLLILCLFLIVFEVIYIMFCGNLGIVLGHRFNKNKMGRSILFGIVIYFIGSIFSLLVMLFVSLFDKGLNNLLFSGSTIVEYSSIILILCVCLGLFIAYNVGLYFITNWQFNKGVNID